jgi:hypothetical protein
MARALLQYEVKYSHHLQDFFALETHDLKFFVASAIAGILIAVAFVTRIVVLTAFVEVIDGCP